MALYFAASRVIPRMTDSVKDCALRDTLGSFHHDRLGQEDSSRDDSCPEAVLVSLCRLGDVGSLDYLPRDLPELLFLVVALVRVKWNPKSRGLQLFNWDFLWQNRLARDLLRILINSIWKGEARAESV